MRRCPHCQAPNPESARACQHCGRELPRLQRGSFWAWSDWFELAALRVAIVPLLAILAFRLTFGTYLTVGLERREGRFLLFHLMHGVLFGSGLAWVQGDVARGRAWRWVLVGALAGLFAEALEYWYTFQHVMQGIAFKLVEWFQDLNMAAQVPYRSLQVLRLAGIVGPLGIVWLLWAKPRPAQAFAAMLWALISFYLRSKVLGYPLTWQGLQTRIGLENLALYALSAFLLLYAFGPREKALTRSA